MLRKKLAVVLTHPIQYYAPIFKLLAIELELMVFYTWGKDSVKKFDPGFGKVVEWDIPVLEGYPYAFVENKAKKPGSNHFWGIKNPTIIQEIKNYRPDCILVFGWAYYTNLKVLTYFKGKIPIIFRGDSTLLDDNADNLKSKFRGYAKNMFLKWVYRHIDIALYCGTQNKIYFENYGLKPLQLVFAPHAIDNQRFALQYKEEKVVQIRTSLNVNSEEILILFAGKFETKKNPVLLLEIFKSINRKGIHLLFVGNGILENELRQLSEGMHNVHFVPFQNQQELPNYYHAADLFCLPSKGPGETWGLAVNEAMACSKAILVSNKVGCATDLVINNSNGYLFNFESETEFAEKLELLISNKLELKKMGQNSKTLISAWDMHITANSILNIVAEGI